MPRSFAVNNKCFPMAAEVVISLVLVLLMALALSPRLQAQGPALTTISDTVYRADGTAASGTVLISWPSFQTAEGDAVAAGDLSVTIGPLGAFTAQLVPNVGASPAGTYYVVVFQLDDGAVRTEYWAVPATSPTTIAAVLTTPGTGLGNLAATQQYVNTAVANRAIDTTVVHVAGSETITGTKQFAVPPELPAPAGANDAANKGYVDAAVANVGAGAYVSKAGDTMTGPLTLPADPTAPNQAADRHYVDSGLSVKADLVNGTVPPSELGAGVASAATCLNGNSTWGSCGSGAPAGITYATTALNWTQTISSSLTGGSQATVTLTPCPVGIDTTSGVGYQVLLSGGGNSEAVSVVTASGGCTSGAASGTITFTPFYSYAGGYAIGSASSGIQETLNAGCGVNTTTYKNSQCNVTIPANGPNSSVNIYNVSGTIYLHSNQSVLSGYGTSLNCLGRGACLQVGDLKTSNDFTNNTVAGLSFRTPVSLVGNAAFAGVAITQTQRTSQVATITTASAHGFRVGDMVTILFTDSSSYWGDAIITAVPSLTTFQYAHSGADIAAQASPGVVVLAYVAVLDNAENTHLIDISYDKVGENGQFNNFFDLWDDENVTIDHFNNQGISLNNNANWTGSFVFSAGNQSMQIAPVITLRDSSITANYSNGVTDYNSNGLYIENTILQATGPWQVYSSNSTGNYQGAYLKNIYSESSNSLNPQTPAHSPFPGLGIAGLIAGISTGAAKFQISGSGTLGAFATGGTGSTPYSYFIVANDTTAGTQTSPMQILNWLSTGNDSIPIRWPRVANGNDVITYDVIRITTPAGVGAVYPYNGGCLGGSGGTCGYVAKGLLQSAACSGSLVCTYTDNGSSSTSAYTIKQANYGGNLNFWPGSLVSVNKSVTVDVEELGIVGVGLNGNPLQIANQCSNYGTASPGGYTACLASVTSSNNSVPNQTATIVTDGTEAGGGMSLSKGRLNFSSAPAIAINAHHIITLIDSQPALTQSTWGYRPAASANDTWIGTDVPNSGVGVGLGQLAFGSPVSITNYIAQTGDGIHANWLERLSASLKEFNVPAKFDQSVTFTGNNTHSGSETFTGTTSVSSLNKTIFADQQAGATIDAKVNACIAAVIAGGGEICDATGLTSSGTVAAQISVGNSSSYPVTLLLPPSASWIVSITDGVSCGIKQYSKTRIIGAGLGNNGSTFRLIPASTSTSVRALYCTDPASTGSYIQADNFLVDNYNVVGTMAVAALEFAHLFDNSTVRNVSAITGGGIGAQIYDICCGTSFDHLNVDGSSSSGVTPLVVGNSTLGGPVVSGGVFRAAFNDASVTHPGAGMPDISIAASVYNDGITFNNLYMEPNGTDTSTALVQIGAQAHEVGFNGFALAATAGGSTAYAVDVATWAGPTDDYFIGCKSQTRNCVNDHVTGVTLVGAAAYGQAAPYFSGSLNLGLANGCLNIASGVIGSTGSACGSGGGGGTVSSVFGRSGAIVAASGDYTVSQVTGAAADASVVHNTGAETIAGAKTFTSNVTMSGNLLLPQGNAYVPAAGGIGLDTAAGLPVVNIGGTTHQVAFTSSNISGQAGTALALAAVPTQCSGSFATGIAANGNANCTTPNVIQLSETTPPAGIPNWGVFWFDSATHTPRVIENNGQVTQLGLTNLFNSDPGGDTADNLEERNGSAAQSLRVYSNYVNNTTWTRMSLGSETIGATNYNVLRSEDATSGNALSLGMHIGSAIKWFFSSDGTFKPNSDNSYDIGTDTGQAMRSVFAKTSFNMYSTGRQDFEFLNDATNGTTPNQLAIYNSGATGVQTAATSSTDGVVGIVSGGAGTSNKAVITWAGFAACNFDAANPIAGDYVIASTTQAGKCHDTGSTTRPTGMQVIGQIESGGVRVNLGPPSGSSGGGAVSSVFGRTGAVTAATGDYSVSQVTGAAADTAVVHLAGTETITGAKTFSSDVTLSGNLNVAGNINQTGTGLTQWSGQEWTGTTVTVPSGMAFSLGVGSDNTFRCQLTSGASCMPPGAVTSVFGRTGAVVATSGDYSVSQITGAAPLASPTFTGTPLAPTPSTSDSSTKLATTAYVQAQSYATTGTLVTGDYAKASGAGAIADSGVVAGPYGTEWVTSARAGTATAFDTTGTKIKLWGITLSFPLSTSNLSYNVSGADGSSSVYDLGIYNSSGTLKAHTGPIVATTSMTSGAHSVGWTGTTPITLQPGKYYLAITTNCTTSCATLSGDGSSAVVTFLSAGTVTTSGTQGTLDATITPPADSYTWSGSMMAFIVR
ncbi:MAG: hypothetical protein ABR920_12605 [Terriglobales bacterium]